MEFFYRVLGGTASRTGIPLFLWRYRSPMGTFSLLLKTLRAALLYLRMATSPTKTAELTPQPRTDDGQVFRTTRLAARTLLYALLSNTWADNGDYRQFITGWWEGQEEDKPSIALWADSTGERHAAHHLAPALVAPLCPHCLPWENICRHLGRGLLGIVRA